MCSCVCKCKCVCVSVSACVCGGPAGERAKNGTELRWFLDDHHGDMNSGLFSAFC